MPCFVTIVFIPLTFSITQGMLWGFLAHVGLYAAAGRRRELRATMWAIAAVAVLMLALEGR